MAEAKVDGNEADTADLDAEIDQLETALRGEDLGADVVGILSERLENAQIAAMEAKEAAKAEAMAELAAIFEDGWNDYQNALQAMHDALVKLQVPVMVGCRIAPTEMAIQERQKTFSNLVNSFRAAGNTKTFEEPAWLMRLHGMIGAGYVPEQARIDELITQFKLDPVA